MKTKIPRKLTVQVDTREKCPLLFPSIIEINDPDKTFKKIRIPITTQKIKLDIGDYRLAEFPNCCVVERKGSQSEIYKNLFNPKDQIRQAKAFRKLTTAQHPILLLELSPSALLSKTATNRGWFLNSPDVLLHRLSMVIVKYRLHLIWITKPTTVNARRTLGKAIIHLMLGYALRDLIDVPVSVNELLRE